MEHPELGAAQMRVSKHGNLLEVLTELQGKMCFVKQMTASMVLPLDSQGRILRLQNMPCQLSLPRYFVHAHKTYLLNPECVVRLNDTSWNLRLKHTSKEEFIFTRGWRRFVSHSGFLKGDILVFSLTAVSKFQLYLFDNSGLRKAPQMLEASARPKRKASSDDKIADLASNIAACQDLYRRNTRSTKAKIGEGSSLKTCHGANLEEEPLSDQEALVKPFSRDSKARLFDTNLNCFQQSEIHASPKAESLLPASFQKQLRKQNLDLLEIPADFFRKYGSQLQTRVQLQGILEVSPVRDVGSARVSYKSDGRPRFFLKDGWRDFVRDNMLRVGQAVIFTLTADSYFEVREVIDPLSPGSDPLDIGQWSY